MSVYAFALASWLALIGSATAAGAKNPCDSASGGVFPEVAFFRGHLWCAVQAKPGLEIVELSDKKEVLSSSVIPLGPGALAFPRMSAEQGSLWLVYRDFENAKLRDVVSGAEQTLGPAGGNDPVAIGNGFVAWQAADGQMTVQRRPLAGGEVKALGPGRPTGLSRILPGGNVTLIDDDRMAVPDGTRPCWAGGMTVVEGPEKGNIARLNGRRNLLFPGQTAYTPKCAANGGRYAVVAWGDGLVHLAVWKGDFGGLAAQAGAAVEETPKEEGSSKPRSSAASAVDQPSAAGGASPIAGTAGVQAMGLSEVSQPVPAPTTATATGTGTAAKPPPAGESSGPRNARFTPSEFAKRTKPEEIDLCEDPYRAGARAKDDVALFAECRGVVWMIRNSQKALACSPNFTYHHVPAWQWQYWIDHEAAEVMEACKDVCHPGNECEKQPDSVDKDRLVRALENYWRYCISYKGISCICNPKEGVCPQFKRFMGRGAGRPQQPRGAKVSVTGNTGGGGGSTTGGPKAKYCKPPRAKETVEAVLARPGMGDALRRACRNNTDWTFPDAVIDELRKTDLRWGYWCRRGHCNDPSHDVLAYYCGEGSPKEGADAAAGIDYIVASCYDGPDDGNPSIGWGLLEANDKGKPGWTSRGRF